MWNPFKKSSTDAWIMAEATENDLPVLFRMRGGMPEGVDAGAYPRLVNIFWAYDGEANGGMPPASTHAQMVALETALDRVEGGDVGFMVLSITGNGRKEWVWYVRDDATFLDSLNRALAGQEKYPIELEGADDPEWKSFVDLLGRLRQVDA